MTHYISAPGDRDSGQLPGLIPKGSVTIVGLGPQEVEQKSSPGQEKNWILNPQSTEVAQKFGFASKIVLAECAITFWALKPTHTEGAFTYASIERSMRP